MNFFKLNIDSLCSLGYTVAAEHVQLLIMINDHDTQHYTYYNIITSSLGNHTCGCHVNPPQKGDALLGLVGGQGSWKERKVPTGGSAKFEKVSKMSEQWLVDSCSLALICLGFYLQTPLGGILVHAITATIWQGVQALLRLFPSCLCLNYWAEQQG